MDIDQLATANLNTPPPDRRKPGRKAQTLRRLIGIGNLLAAQSTQPQLRDAWERALAALHEEATCKR